MSDDHELVSTSSTYLTPASGSLAAALETSVVAEIKRQFAQPHTEPQALIGGIAAHSFATGFRDTLSGLTGVTADVIKLIGAADVQIQGITTRASDLLGPGIESFCPTEIVSSVIKLVGTEKLLQLTTPALTGDLRRESYQVGDVFRLTGPTVPDEWKVSSDGSIPAYKLHSALPSSLHYREPDSDPLYITVKPPASMNERTITGVQLSTPALIVGHPTTWQPEPGIRITQAGALLEIEPVKPFYTVGQNTLSYGKPTHELLYVPEPAPLQPAKRLPPPPNGNSGTSPTQPVQPADWRAALAADLKAGRAKPGDVLKLVAQVITLPPVETLRAELRELEPLEQAWQRVKGRKTPVRFAADHGMSRATLYRRWDRLKELRLLLEVWQ